MKNLILALLIGTAVLVSPQAFAASKVENLHDITVPTRSDGSKLSLDEIREAIFAGCRYKRWTPSADGANRIVAEIPVRSHWAQVVISYNENSFSIEYKNSRNLDYNPKKNTIHRNYNKWVTLLSQAIQAEMSRSL